MPLTPRVALMVTELGPGGAEQIVYDIATRVRPRFDTFVVALRSPDAEDGLVASRLRAAGVPVRPLRVRGKFDVPRLIDLIGVLRAERPAILHAHLFHANVVARLVAPWVGHPAVISTHHAVERRPLAMRFRLDRWTARLDDRTVAVSQAAATFATTETGVKPDRLRVIANGTDLSATSAPRDRLEARRALGWPAAGLIVGALGRLDEQKGHTDLIRAWPVVQAAHLGARLVIAGEGALRTDLEALAAALGVSASVSLPGHCHDVPAFMAGVDLFAMPSRSEGFGLALVEAMAAGAACLTTNVDALPEVIGDAGVLVPPENAAALGSAIAGLLADPVKRQSLGEAGRCRSRLFSVERMAEAYADLYDDVLAACGRLAHATT